MLGELLGKLREKGASPEPAEKDPNLAEFLSDVGHISVFPTIRRMRDQNGNYINEEILIIKRNDLANFRNRKNTAPPVSFQAVSREDLKKTREWYEKEALGGWYKMIKRGLSPTLIAMGLNQLERAIETPHT